MLRKYIVRRASVGTEARESELGRLAIESGDIGYSLEHLRILSGPICAACKNNDGEIIPATHRTAPYYGPSEDECEACYSREPGDQGIDDGPPSFAEQCAENEREFRGLR